MNKYTSKNTSINAKRAPKGLSLLYPYGNVLDYGCGKYWKLNKKYVEERGATYTPYDPYNIENNIDLDKYEGAFDTIYCTNVLNVIYDSYDLIKVIENIAKLLKVNGMAIFTVYEGDKTGNGKETMKDCWQRNMKTKSYYWFFDYAVIENCLVKFTASYIKMRKFTRSEYEDIKNHMEIPF